MMKANLSGLLDKMERQYDLNKSMIYENRSEWQPEQGGGYHSRHSGIVHLTRETADFISLVYLLEDHSRMPLAEKSILALLKIQDMDERSKTYGLWSYLLEENLQQMLTPDFNWANFISNQLAYVLKKRSHYLSEELKQKLIISLIAAAECTKRRNVAADYTNISFMSVVTLACAGEMGHMPQLLSDAKIRLKKAYSYNQFSGNFSEFNSPVYTLVAIEELTRLTFLVDDADCRRWAGELLFLAWETTLKHYDRRRYQLCPPHSRAYSDFIANKDLEAMIYVATDGKFGDPGDGMSTFFKLPLKLPAELEHYLFNPQKTCFMQDIFYRKNTIRDVAEEMVIIPDVDCPDLKAYSYISERYSMGTFEKTDLWAQRRTNMVYWGEADVPKAIRLRCIATDSDYCSGMAYSAMYKNGILSTTGFALDHGAFHYLLDKDKGGIIKTQKLFFCFEINAKDVKVQQNGNTFKVYDSETSIFIHIIKAVFDGCDMSCVMNSQQNRIEMICYDDGREVDFNHIGQCYIIFTMSIHEKMQCLKAEIYENTVHAAAAFGGKLLEISSPAIPRTYLESLKTTKISIK